MEYGVTIMAAPLIAICCVCKRVRDDDPAFVSAAWTDLTGYLGRRQLSTFPYRLSHTYCPTCLAEQSVPSLEAVRSRRTRRGHPSSMPSAVANDGDEALLTNRKAS